MTRKDPDPWGNFWARQKERGRADSVPAGLRAIDDAQRILWEGFARRLPKRAQVLDLATGDGVVLLKLRSARGDLKLIGVDAAAHLPPALKGITLRPSAAMEKLPFPDGQFDAVTSQFGYEYGDTPAVAREVARVMRRKGAVLLMMHHMDGPILAHNLPRREAMSWAMNDSGYLEQARAIARGRMLLPIPTPAALKSAPAEARRRFPSQSVAEEFLLAIFQTVELGQIGSPAETLEILDQLEAKALNEIGRINSLESAVCTPERAQDIAGELRSVGLAVEAPTTIAEQGSPRPFAWLLRGRKA